MLSAEKLFTMSFKIDKIGFKDPIFEKRNQMKE